MDDVALLLADLLARCAAGGAPGPGDGVVLSCVPDRVGARGPRWELLVTRGGAVVDQAVADDPAAALRAVLGAPAPGSTDPAGPAGPDGDPHARADGTGGALGAPLRALERIAVAVPLVLDVDAVGDLAPGTGAPVWAWTVTATRWDVLVEGSALRWEAGTAQEALALALADLEDDPLR